MVEWMLPFLTALGTGALSSWGVGGGTLLLVCMTLFLGVGHRKNGYLDKATWKEAALPGTAAALAGALLSLAVDVSLLRKPFGLFLLYGGASMLLSGIRKQ